ncbi:MAG TPA: DNA-directed RNA polymerase subunit L [Candidatus Nanoarchaeia archaeon]|nr:DNA-directed RNA polymerase subunit L [Candidatus Nanoarchaeia archaeon]
MKINWLSNEKNKAEFELIGEDHTFCNAIRKELWEQPDLNLAAYKIPHPLISDPVILVETSKSSPEKLLLSSIESLRKKNKALKEAFSKAVK